MPCPSNNLRFTITSLLSLFHDILERILKPDIGIIYDLINKLIHKLALLVYRFGKLRLALMYVFLITLRVLI